MSAHARLGGGNRPSAALSAAPILLLVALAAAPGCQCTLGASEACFNFVDDDGDELADCWDGDCSASLYCICGIVDPTCACPGVLPAPGPDASVTTPPPDASIPVSPPACIELVCDDRTDNDRDGDEDCEDPDCYAGCGVELGAWVATPLDGGVPTGNNLYAVWGASPNEVFAVGEAGTILRYDGTTWTMEASPTTETLRDIAGTTWAFTGETIAWAVGFNGTILKYQAMPGTIGSWVVEPLVDPMTMMPATINLHGIWTPVDGQSAWAVGDDGTLLFKSGPVPPWIYVTAPVQDTLFDVWGSGSNDIWAAGTFGVIIHWDGATWCEAVLGSPAIGIPTNGSIHGVWGRGPTEVYFAAIGTVVLYDGNGPPCPPPTGPSGYVELSLAMPPSPGAPATQFLDVFGVGNDTFFVGLDGFLVHYTNAGQFFYYVWGDPPAQPAIRYDGIWGYNPYNFDSGTPADSGVPSLGPPYDLIVVGATGTILTGP